MMGGYALSYETIEVDGDEAKVAFTIRNDTTRESLNRIPGSELSMPWALPVNVAHDSVGGFQPTGETVVWTEIVELK
jgi:hypothetical protein